jgi:CO/xanthine dehydrogenase FAD-binding subunit
VSYARPSSLPEAIRLLQAGPARVLAGGTDLYPTAGDTLSGPVVDLTAIPGLRGFRPHNGGLRIGACTTWSDIAEADLPPGLAALQQAALQVGGRQIQNAGTIGGNLCNASPAADGIPPLLACRAEVELTGPQGRREVQLADFLAGPRQTTLAPAEVMTGILIPPSGLQGKSHFLKLGARAYLVISIAMVAVRLTMDGDRIRGASLAVGSCGPVARRLPGVERALSGLRRADAAAAIQPADLAAVLTPIDDIRATAAYRLHAATTLLRRAVTEVLA